MILQFQEVVNFGMFFHVMQIIHFIHFVYDKNKDTPLWIRFIYLHKPV